MEYRARGLGGSVKGRCTLLPLMLKAGSGARAVIVVADTLYAALGEGRPSTWEEIEKGVLCEVKRCWDSFVDECRVDGAELDEGRRRELKSSVEVVVCPGLGRHRFRDLWLEFKGSLELFASTVLLHVLERALRMGRDLELWFDLSHGVNYMPSAALVAASKVGRVLSFLLEPGKVRLRVFNSDPYAPGIVELSINEMELPLGVHQLMQPDVKVVDGEEGRPLADVVLNLLGRLDSLFSGECRREKVRRLLGECGEGFSRAGRIIKDLWFSASHCLPLVALHRIHEGSGGQGFIALADLVKAVREALYETLRSVRIDQAGNGVTIDTASVVDYERWRLLDALLEAYAVAERLYSAGVCYTPADRRGRRGFKLSDVMKFVEDHLSRTAPTGVNFIGREVREILRYLLVLEEKGSQLGCWRLYDDLRGEALNHGEGIRAVDERLESKVDGSKLAELMMERTFVRYRDGFEPSYGDRNFLAHLGLTYRDVEIYYEPLARRC